MQSLRRTRPENLAGHHDPGRDRPARPDPGRRRQPLHRAPPAAARRPRLRGPLRASRRSSRCCARRSGTIIFQDQVLEVAIAFAGFSPGRGGGAAAGDEPQALGGGDRGLPRALRRGRAARARGRRGDRRAGVRDGPGLLRLRLPQGARRRLRAARLPVDVAARPLRARVPLLAAQRAADGLLSARRARPRGAAARDRGAARPTSTRARRSARLGRRDRRGRVRIGLGYVRGVRAQEVEALVAAREARRALSQPLRSRLARRRRRARRSSCSPGRGPATRWRSRGRCARPGASAARLALWQLGRGDARARSVPGGTQLALPLDLPAPPGLRELSRWESMLADYGTTGLTAAHHPLALLRAAPAGGRRDQPRPRAARARHAGCGSAGWWSRASVRGRRTGSCSSCSRTSTGRST